MDSSFLQMSLGGLVALLSVLLIWRWRISYTLAQTNFTLQLRAHELETRLRLLTEEESRLKDTFSRLSSEALAQNSQAFLTLAQENLKNFQATSSGDLALRQQAIEGMVRPLRDSLGQLVTSLQILEQNRAGAYEGLKEQILNLSTTQKDLRQETHNLVKALRTPHVRGRWGELQLRRVVEMAGMLSHCDFFEQVSGDNNRARPDMIIRLPGKRQIIVDSKVPLMAYLEAQEASDDELRKQKLQDHARHLRTHMTALGTKSYWDTFANTPDFVILFLPNDGAFLAALEADPSLIENALNDKVIFSTPTTLIALLRAISFGWRQEHLSENARKVADLGTELLKRLNDFSAHLMKVGRTLSSSVEAYNQAIGSFEHRVYVTARKIQELQPHLTAEEAPPAPLTSTIRLPTEMTG